MKRTYKTRAAGSGDRFRSVLLSITFCGMLLVMALLHWGCDSHQPRHGKCETLPRKIEEMSTSTLMPSSSRNIDVGSPQTRKETYHVEKILADRCYRGKKEIGHV